MKATNNRCFVEKYRTAIYSIENLLQTEKTKNHKPSIIDKFLLREATVLWDDEPDPNDMTDAFVEGRAVCSGVTEVIMMLGPDCLAFSQLINKMIIKVITYNENLL